jgi:hypothetical protein
MTDEVFDQVREYVSTVPVTGDVRERARARVDSLLAGDNGDLARSSPRSSSPGPHFGVLSTGTRLKVAVAVAASVAVILGIVLAAHGSSPTHANSTGPRPAATTTVPLTTSTVPASYARCTTAQLSVSAGSYGEAGGMYSQTFTFTNRSGGTCRMGGWPGFQAVSDSGQTVRTPTQHVRQNAPSEPVWTTIDLKPGAKASFDVYNSDWNPIENTACPNTSAARITPPGARGYLSVRVQIPDCSDFRFDIAPVIAGAKDNQAWSEVVS